MTSQPDIAPMTIPVWEVLRMALAPAQWRIGTAGREAYLAEINALAPPARRLRLLVELMASTGYIYDKAEGSLQHFFSQQMGALAPEMLTALREAGLNHRATAFADAMAVFGPTYPVDNKQRGAFFAYHFMDAETMGSMNTDAPPTPADLKLTELSAQFGTNADLKREIEAYVASDPESAAVLAQARHDLADADRLSYLLSQLYSKLDGFAPSSVIETQLDTLPKAYRTLLLLSIFVGEIINGGMSQFFSNSSGAYAPDVLAELRALGLTRAANALARALALFPADYPRSTTPRRKAYFAGGWSDLDAKLNALEPAVDVEAIHAAALAFAARENCLPR